MGALFFAVKASTKINQYRKTTNAQGLATSLVIHLGCTQTGLLSPGEFADSFKSPVSGDTLVKTFHERIVSRFDLVPACFDAELSDAHRLAKALLSKNQDHKDSKEHLSARWKLGKLVVAKY